MITRSRPRKKKKTKTKNTKTRYRNVLFQTVVLLSFSDGTNEEKNALPLSTEQPVATVREQGRVRPVADVLPGARAGAGQRVAVVARAAAGVRATPDQAVLDPVGAAARPPPAAGQVHGRDGGRHPHGPLDQRGGGQRAAVPAQHTAGRRDPRPAGAAVLLLRV